MADKHVDSEALLEDVLTAAGIELDPKGLYPAKKYRNCQSMAALLGAVGSALRLKDREITRLHKQTAELADRCSKESSRSSALAERLSKSQLETVKRGLENVPELSEITRKRLMDVA